MEFKPTEFCKVCKHYRMDLHHCTRGWEHTDCGGDDFKPSFLTAIQNFLDDAEFYNVLKSTEIEKLWQFAYKRFKEPE